MTAKILRHQSFDYVYSVKSSYRSITQYPLWTNKWIICSNMILNMGHFSALIVVRHLQWLYKKVRGLLYWVSIMNKELN